MAKLDDSARDLVTDTARNLRAELMPHIAGPIEFMQRIISAEDGTDGCYTKIADCEDIVQNHTYAIELWYDTFATRDQRCFWYGFSTPGKRAINSLVKHCPNHLPSGMQLSDGDLDDSETYSMLRNPIPKAELPTPRLEKYTGGHSFFGMYDDSEALNILRATEFFRNVLMCLPDFEINLLAEDYQGFEGRQKVSWHLRRERDMELAKLCKKRDGYRCRICKRIFEEEYGVLGRHFAEAHHVVPLSQLEGTVTNTVNDLITVCANCHRMLHKLPGSETDVETLKKIYFQIAPTRPGK